MNDNLKVLDMSEDEQWEWLEKKYGLGVFHSFETLAWRLRDELGGEVVNISDRYNFEMALRQVFTRVGEGSEFLIWIVFEAKPIHWILAAIIAKES